MYIYTPKHIQPPPHNSSTYPSILTLNLLTLSHIISKLEVMEERLITVERPHRHEIGEWLVVLVGCGNELRSHSTILDALHVHIGEEGVLQDGSGRTLRHT